LGICDFVAFAILQDHCDIVVRAGDVPEFGFRDLFLNLSDTRLWHFNHLIHHNRACHVFSDGVLGADSLLILLHYEFGAWNLHFLLLEDSDFFRHFNRFDDHFLEHSWDHLPLDSLYLSVLVFGVHVAVLVLVFFVEVGCVVCAEACGGVGAAAATAAGYFARFLAGAGSRWGHNRHGLNHRLDDRWWWCNGFDNDWPHRLNNFRQQGSTFATCAQNVILV
jgi:hypothetical protein